MGKLKIIPTKLLIIFIVGFLCMECTPAPRYKSGKSSFSAKQKKKNSKSKKKLSYNPKKMVYKGISSYYGPQFHGKLTANGEIFDMYGVTAAHKELPFNTVVRVTNIDNNKSLILRINDRGPYIDGRILDCSYGAAKKLDFLNKGTTNVEIRVIEWGDGKYMQHIK